METAAAALRRNSGRFRVLVQANTILAPEAAGSSSLNKSPVRRFPVSRRLIFRRLRYKRASIHTSNNYQLVAHLRETGNRPPQGRL